MKVNGHLKYVIFASFMAQEIDDKGFYSRYFPQTMFCFMLMAMSVITTARFVNYNSHTQFVSTSMKPRKWTYGVDYCM